MQWSILSFGCLHLKKEPPIGVLSETLENRVKNSRRNILLRLYRYSSSPWVSSHGTKFLILKFETYFFLKTFSFKSKRDFLAGFKYRNCCFWGNCFKLFFNFHTIFRLEVIFDVSEVALCGKPSRPISAQFRVIFKSRPIAPGRFWGFFNFVKIWSVTSWLNDSLPKDSSDNLKF